MKIPLINRLKKQSHRKLAMLQDEIVDIIYAICPEAVLHGGTAIWRCYSGSRFSEDLDFYLSPGRDFKKMFSEMLASRDLALSKYKETENTVFSKIADAETEIRLECAFRKPKNSVACAYEKADGTTMAVLALSRDDLVMEKISAYENRRLIKDLYDIYFLSAEPLGETTGSKVRQFLKTVQKPLDEKNLRAVVYSGAVPSFSQMLEALKRRFLK